jgi:galactokinase
MAGTASQLREEFEARYGTRQGLRVFRAPGRVNLIGEHTDYCQGFVLPIAIGFACWVAAAPSADGRLRVWSENLRQLREWPVEDLAGLERTGEWSDYVTGVARELVRAGHYVGPMNLFVWSTVPVGGGLSSSAALEVSTALALWDESPGLSRLGLAQLCLRAEVEFVGLPCGIMDQYISLFGEAGCAVKIDCRTLEHETVRLPPDIAIVAVNSMVKHELGGSAYRDRVRECAEAVESIRKRFPSVESLRDVSAEQIEFSSPLLLAGLPRKRARHVITENQRVEEFLIASRRADREAMGELLVASHRSLQHDYEVSSEELDFLVETALAITGVYGARMTGGGFGGCTVNLLRPEAVEEFKTVVQRSYQARYGIEPQVYLCEPSAGAGEIS